MRKIKDNRFIIVVVILVLLLGFVFLCIFLLKERNANTPKQLSVMIRDYADEYGQSSLKQGFEEGTNIYKAEISIITFKQTISVTEYIEMIQREIKNGADSLIIEPLNDPELLKYLKSVKSEVNILFINTSIAGQIDFPVIKSDQKQMNYRLVETIKQEEIINKGDVAILRTTEGFLDVDENVTYLVDELQRKGRKVKVQTVDAQNETNDNLVITKLEDYSISQVISMDKELLLKVSQLKKHSDAMELIQLYGYGKSNEIIRELQTGCVSGVLVNDDYSIGYLSVKQAVTGQRKSLEIQNKWIQKKDIFTKESQQLLFPIHR